jgi:pimeloyl-ACP methyl ester carboxylesterase
MQVVEELQDRPSGSTEFIELHDCGHYVMEDQREVFMASLCRFAEACLETPVLARRTEGAVNS